MISLEVASVSSLLASVSETISSWLMSMYPSANPLHLSAGNRLRKEHDVPRRKGSRGNSRHDPQLLHISTNGGQDAEMAPVTWIEYY